MKSSINNTSTVNVKGDTMIFLTTLSQMAYLFALIAVGYILARFNFVPKGTENILSKLENYVFIQSLVISTFLTNFTVEKLSGAGALLLGSAGVLVIVIPLSILCARICSKDKYMRNIYSD